ncbi:GPI mannosyltransferase 1 [Cephus cinctus]|uniref:GPI alpha-1,4-mannosyltransferase I, catalytic subunit n=1 Tax=Cephus cinctus TaxID=211228 RepID=A0AAJ7FS75_CEPCN|nr:GPI mannosyltransferase 1 [Cephus cinctus]
MSLTFARHCIVALTVRVILIVYANFHDNNFDVPYTDVDYKVFTDAARHIIQRESPFERHTYRYTPLLALLLTPNILLHLDFGKLIFSLVDILVSLLIKRILIKQYCTRSTAEFCALLWLYNPLTIVISTRGNADSLAVLLVLLTLSMLQNDNSLLTGVLHGLSIHFRLYPIAFSLAMYLSLHTKNQLIALPNVKQVKLILGCILSLSLLTASCYYFYGYKFLYESLIYHLIRKDARHNFSVYFYMQYLTALQVSGILQKILTFLPQLVLLVILSVRYSTKFSLPFAMFTQALVMVTYNPVMTSQYFFWFLSLLPICLTNLCLSKCRSIFLLGIWLIAQGLWLFAAYLLEFKGLNSFLYIWIAGLLFFMANVKILLDIIVGYRDIPQI